jgi:thermitase
MKKALIVLAIAILVISTFPAIASAAPPDSPTPVPDFSSQQILVKFKPGTSLPEAAQIHRQLGGQIRETIPGIGVQVVTVPKGQAMAKAKAYCSNPRVAYAEPDFVVQVAGTPDDPYFGRQYALTKIEAPQAWDVTAGSPSINIAILDTGVDQNHPDLADKIVSDINFTSSPTADDIHGHGTHVAGIAAAMTNNGIGVAGLGCSCTIMNVKVLGDTGAGTYSAIAAGITWAADNGAEVINMSLGGSGYSSTLEDAVNYAWSKGVVVVAAAGNDGSTSPMYPAYFVNCIAVAATTSLDSKASFSNYGDWVDVAAPGTSIYSTRRDGTYGYGAGTSMASPHVAGLAGLVSTVVNDTSGNGRVNDEVRARIEATCDDIGVTGIGAGRINAYKAVSDGGTTPPPPPTGSIAGTVTDAEDGSAIAGAAVSDGTRTVLTDAAGQYTINDVPPDTYQVSASKSGYGSLTSTVTVVSGGTAVADFSLNEVSVPGSITGTVTDAEDGSAIAGVTVTDGTRTTTTDATAKYTIADVPQGTYQVSASKSGYQSSSLTVTVVSGGTAIADFSLTEVIVPGSITGSVSDAKDGSALAGATVTDGTRATLSDAAGQYIINDVPPGTYQVSAGKSGYESLTSTVMVVSGGTAVADFSLNEVSVPGNITGTVTDAEEGSAIAGATVTDGTRTALSDATGQYIINDVPQGTYQVSASKSGYESLTSTVAVVSGGTAVMNFSLIQKPPSTNNMWVDAIGFDRHGVNLFIEVRVVTASGGVSNANVDLRLECSNGDEWSFSGTTDSSGLVKFKLGKAPAGSYSAVVTSLTCSGFTWDATKGVTAASYALSG